MEDIGYDLEKLFVSVGVLVFYEVYCCLVKKGL